MVATAVGLLTPLPSWDGAEGPRWRIQVAPGALGVTSTSPARAHRTYERRANGHALLAADRLNGFGATAASHLRDQVDADLVDLAAAAETGVVPWADVEAEGRWADHVGRAADRHDGVLEEGPALRKAVTSWSARSRGRMTRRLAELDYAPMFATGDTPAMVTLTYPGLWEHLAPTALHAKRHVDELKRRWAKAWGTPIVGTWKREFQRRGAPHYHLHVVPPTTTLLSTNGERINFVTWLSRTWASIVGADTCGAAEPVRQWTTGRGSRRRLAVVCCERHRHEVAGTGVDYAEGMRCADPRRLAIYFAKHGGYSAKEYQNQAPALWVENGSVGRFWGYWGLDPAVGEVEVAPGDAAAARRVLAGWQDATGYRVQRPVWRKRYRVEVDTTTGEVVEGWRWHKRRSGRMVGSRWRGERGFALVNDGPGFAAHIARYLDRAAGRPESAGVGIRAGLALTAAPATATYPANHKPRHPKPSKNARNP